MTTEALRSSYRPGGWFGIFGESATVLLPPSEKARVTALWELVDDGAGFDEVLDGLLSAGLRDLPGFVLISPAEQGTKVVLRGPAVAAFVTGGEMVQLAGSSETTWVERTLSDVTQLFVQVEPTDDDGEDFVITTGLVRVARIEQPPYVAEEPEAATAEPADTAAEPTWSDQAPGAESGVEDPGGAAAPVPVPAPVVADSAASPMAAASALGDFEAPGPEGPVETGEPVAEEPGPAAAEEWSAEFGRESAPEWSEADGAAPDFDEAAPGFDEAAPGFDEAAPAFAEAATPEPMSDDYVTEDLGSPLVAEESAPDTQDPVTEAFAPADPLAGYTASAAHLGMSQEPGGWAPDSEFAAPASAAVARLLLSSGQVVEVDGPVLIGRAPEPRRIDPAEQARVIAVPSPHQEISSTHLEIRPGAGADHGAAVVTDLGSTNGTVLVQPGLPPEDLQPGVGVQLLPGAIIDLGDGLTIQVTSV